MRCSSSAASSGCVASELSSSDVAAVDAGSGSVAGAGASAGAGSGAGAAAGVGSGAGAAAGAGAGAGSVAITGSVVIRPKKSAAITVLTDITDPLFIILLLTVTGLPQVQVSHKYQYRQFQQ